MTIPTKSVWHAGRAATGLTPGRLVGTLGDNGVVIRCPSPRPAAGLAHAVAAWDEQRHGGQ